MINSHSLVFSDFDTKWYKHWAKELKQDKDNLGGMRLRSNKFWQNAIMAQILYERGMLNPDRRGLGFGVGQERLPALFANRGVKITATDQDFTHAKAKHWSKNELAKNALSLNKLGIADQDAFIKNVSFEAADMTKIPEKYNDRYDFVWSNCALGHLGSINKGISFLLDSARCLKPGGYALHTTELNVLKNDETLDAGDTVIFTPKDIYMLSKLLSQEGYKMKPLKLNFGNSKKDNKITMHPEYGNDYSKIHLRGHLLTQVVLIIHKPKINSNINLLSKHIHKYNYHRNVKKQDQYCNKEKFNEYLNSLEKSKLSSMSLVPVRKVINIKVANTPSYVYVEFENRSNNKIYSMHKKSNTSWPILLATADPTDRYSKFQADDWVGGQANRPSMYIFEKTKNNSWIKLDYVKPRSRFSYRIKLDPKKVKKGQYSESFAIVQEGIKHLEASKFTLNIQVTEGDTVK
ncbi:MAG: methyltransferase domain-containing protein [Patescibacteria group bacterium]